MSEEQMKKNVSDAWFRLAKGIQIGMLDLPKIFQMGINAQRTGQNLDKTIEEAIKKFRRN